MCIHPTDWANSYIMRRCAKHNGLGVYTCTCVHLYSIIVYVE